MHELNTNKANYLPLILNQRHKPTLGNCSILECPVFNLSCLKYSTFGTVDLVFHAHKGLMGNGLLESVEDDDL